MPIAFDASAEVAYNVENPKTFSHTCSGSDRILFLALASSSGGKASAVTYNGVSMTLIGEVEISSSWSQLWYLIAPATGTNTISITNGGGVGAAVSMSYTGASQTGVPDSYDDGVGVATSLTVSTTVVAANCWLVGAFCNYVGTGAAAGTGTTARNNITSDDYECWGMDSNGTVGTGSQSLQITSTIANLSGVVASFAPAGEAPPEGQMTGDEGGVMYQSTMVW